MASPQKENGYTPIANELIEQLYKLPLSGTKLRILLLVFRYTYGFSRKEHDLSENFIASALYTNKRQIQREIKSLIDANVLLVTKQATFNSSKIVAFNKDYDKWNIDYLVTKMSTVTEMSPSDKNVIPSSNVPNIESGSENGFEDLGMTKMSTVTFSPPGDILAAQENNSINNIIIDNKQTKTKKPNFNSNIINYFCEQYLKKFENKYMPNWGRDGKIIKDFLDSGYTEEFMQKYICWYFNCNDEYLNGNGYSIPLLKSRLEKYHLTLKKPQEKSKYTDRTNYEPG